MVLLFGEVIPMMKKMMLEIFCKWGLGTLGSQTKHNIPIEGRVDIDMGPDMMFNGTVAYNEVQI